MTTKFEQFGDRVVEAIRSGVSIDDTARKLDIGARTVERWLAKGREAPSGPYGRFAAQVDAARQLQEIPGSAEADLMDRRELRRLVDRAARNGSVPAMRLANELIDEPQQQGPDAIDEMVARRKARLAAQREEAGR